MDITKLIESLPSEIKDQVIDYYDIQMGERLAWSCCLTVSCRRVRRRSYKATSISWDWNVLLSTSPKSSILTSTWYERCYV